VCIGLTYAGIRLKGGPGEVHVTCLHTYLRLLRVVLNIERTIKSFTSEQTFFILKSWLFLLKMTSFIRKVSECQHNADQRSAISLLQIPNQSISERFVYNT